MIKFINKLFKKKNAKEKKDYSIEALDKKVEQSNKATEKIAKKYGVTYDVAISIWNDMGKAYEKHRENA